MFAVRATGGTYKLSVNGGEEPAGLTGPIAWDATAEELQTELEAVPDIGAGNVTVTGGPGDERGTKPYVLTYGGELTGQTEHLVLRDNKLTGGEATVNQEESQDVGGSVHDRYTLTITNVGSRPSEGEVTITDKLPPGLVLRGAEVEEPQSTHEGSCALTAPLTCTYGEAVPAGDELLLTTQVAVSSPSLKGEVTNEATVSGGGASETAASESTAVNAGPAPFGIDQLAFEASGLDGGRDDQAGDHPYGVTTDIQLNSVLSARGSHMVAREVKDLAVDLPLGFLGDPLSAEQCPAIDMTNSVSNGGPTTCPPGSKVGTMRLIKENGSRTPRYPVYNLVPEHGYPAELGVNAGLAQPVFMYASVVRSSSGYGLRVATPGVLRAVGVEGVSLTIFGNPGERDGTGGTAAFVTNPSACSAGPLSVMVEATAWEGGSSTAEATAYPGVTGCDLLQGPAGFDAGIEVSLREAQADTPSGYKVELTVPQAPDVFGELATPELKDATVTLPAGVSVSPSVASGPDALEGCEAEGPRGSTSVATMWRRPARTSAIRKRPNWAKATRAATAVPTTTACGTPRRATARRDPRSAVLKSRRRCSKKRCAAMSMSPSLTVVAPGSRNAPNRPPKKARCSASTWKWRDRA